MNSNTHLEVQDDCPYEPQHDGRPAVHHIAGVYVDQFDLENGKCQYAITTQIIYKMAFCSLTLFPLRNSNAELQLLR